MNKQSNKYIVCSILMLSIFSIFIVMKLNIEQLNKNLAFTILTSISFIAVVISLYLFAKSTFNKNEMDYSEVELSKVLGYFKDMTPEEYNKLYNKFKLEDRKRCQFLNENGEQCEMLASREYKLHLDPEVHNRNWVKVTLCSEHARDIRSW